MLNEGQKIILPDSGPAEVIKITESRARVKLLSKKQFNFTTIAGKDISFEASGRAIDISPNSEVEIIETEFIDRDEKVVKDLFAVI